MTLLRNSTMLSKLGNIDAADATSKLTAVMNAYGVAVEDTSGIIDTLISLDNSLAATTKDIANGMEESSSVAKVAGISYQELAAQIGVIQQITQQSGDTIGNAMKSMYTRLMQVKAGAKIDAETGEDINNVEKVLAEQGIQLRDSAHQFRDMSDVLADVAAKYKELKAAGDTVDIGKITTAIGGTRQANYLTALLDNYDLYIQSLKTVNEQEGISADRYKIYMQSIEAASNEFKAAWQEMWSKTISDDAVKNVIKLGTSILDLITKLGGLVPTLALISGAIMVIRAQKISKSISDFINNIPMLISGLRSWATSLGLVATGEETAAAAAGTLSVATTVATAGIALILGVIAAAIISSKKLSQSFEDVSSAMKESSGAIESSIKKNSELAAQYEELANKQNKSGDDLLALAQIQSTLNDQYGALAQGVNTYNDAIDANSDAIRRNIDWIKSQTDAQISQYLQVNKSAYEAAKKAIANQSVTVYTNERGNLSGRQMGASTTAQTYTTDINSALSTYAKLAEAEKDVNGYYHQQYASLLKTKEALDEIVSLYEQYQSYASGSVDASKDMAEVQARYDELQSKSTDSTNSADDSLKRMVETVVDLSDSEKGLLDTLSEGKDLTDNDITSLQKLSGEVASSVTSSFKTLKDVIDAYNDSGTVSINQAQALIEAGYGQAVSIDTATGSVSININALKTLALQQLSTEIATMRATEAQLRLADSNSIAANEIAKQIAVLEAQKNGLSTAQATASSLSALLGSFSGATKKASSGTSSLSAASQQAKDSYNAETKALRNNISALEDQKNALQDDLDKYKDIIEAQKKKLQRDKDEADYESGLKSKNKKIEDIDNELLQIQFDNSEEANKRRLQLASDRADAEKELASYTNDRIYNLETQALDDEYSAFEKIKKAEMSLIDQQISGYQRLIDKINEMIDALTKSGSSSSSTSSSSSSKKTGYTGVVDYTTGKALYQMRDYDGSYSYTSTAPTKSYHSGGIVESHHDGNFAGGLKSNEVFSKLLKGEYISTEAQMSQFLKSTLPNIVSVANNMQQPAAGDIKLEINVAGNLDKTVLPDLKEIIMKTINDANRQRGITRNATSFTI